MVIGATNRPQEIDEAARRRLVKRLYISLPDGQARRQIVDNLMRQQPFFLSEQEAEEISQRTDGMMIRCSDTNIIRTSRTATKYVFVPYWYGWAL